MTRVKYTYQAIQKTINYQNRFTGGEMGAITVGRDRNFRGVPDLQNLLWTRLGLPDVTKRLPDHLLTSPDLFLIF